MCGPALRPGGANRIDIKMGADLLKRLKARATAEGRSMQDLANELLRDGLARREGPGD